MVAGIPRVTMHIIRYGAKVVAVLGIALVTVLLLAGVLYALQSAQQSGDQGGAGRLATSGPPANAVEPEDAAESAELIEPPSPEPPSRAAETEDSVSASASSVSLPESPISKPEPSVSASNPSEISPTQLKQDPISQADADPALAAGSTLRPTRVAPPPNRSSEATLEARSSSQTASTPTDTRYYTVKEGDTLYSIARTIYGEGKYWKAIYDANRNLIEDPVKLKLTWELEIPPRDKVMPAN